MSHSVEVIIPSYGRIDILLHTIKSIRVLYPDLPVRVALQGDDESERIADAASNTIVDHRPSADLIGAINDAVAQSNADIVILLDDDGVPGPGWLEALVSAFESDSRIAYAYGRVVEVTFWRSLPSEILRIGSELIFAPTVPREAKLSGRIVGWINPLGIVFSNFYLPGRCLINAPAEGNTAIKRDVFLAYGGFNTAFKGNCWGYGPEFGVRLAQDGLYGLYVGDAVMIHRPHRSGGTRANNRDSWYRDYVSNNKLLVRGLGSLAWIGAIPRLIRRYFV